MLFTFGSFLLNGQGLYDAFHVPKIELTFAEEDWQYPLHYYHSLKKGDRHIGQLIIDGEQFDKVGVRFKGFSSYSRKSAKNPLNIKLDHVFNKANYQNYETLKLSNGSLDPSWLREVMAYQIARKYMPAPQSNFAQVFVNDQYYGLFGNTESVDRGFAKRYLQVNKNKVIVKGNSPLGPFAGKRSSLEYLGEDSTAYFTAYEMKSKIGWKELMVLIKTLNRHPENIESVLNMDGAIWMLAFNNVLVNLDSYSDFQQNYYLIQDDNGRFNFVVWDVNLAFDGLGKSNGIIMQPDYDPLAKRDDPHFPLINLVLNNPTYRKIYFAHCRTILSQNFYNGQYKIEAEKYRELIKELVGQDLNWVFDQHAFDQNFKHTFIQEKPYHFPYPGIVELMDARTIFLQEHMEYKKKPPIITEVKARFLETDSSGVVITATIKGAKTAYVAFRKTASHIFQKTPLYDDGKHVDKLANDGIFSSLIPLGGEGVQYYIYVENESTAMFSPERAAHEFYIFKNKEREMPF